MSRIATAASAVIIVCGAVFLADRFKVISTISDTVNDIEYRRERAEDVAIQIADAKKP